MKLIDISHWQGNVDFAKVKASGIEGVILKAGGSDAGFYKDSTYEGNYSKAKAAGLHVGAYYYVGKGCVSAADGEADAKRFEAMIAGKQFDLPVYMDVEDPAPGNNGKVTDAVVAFCSYLEKRGYFVGVYGSDFSGFKDRMTLSRLKNKYSLWVARYGSKPTYATPYDVWQYSSTGKVSGISGNVDMDECYKDFPSIIKNGGFNGYPKGSKPVPTPAPKPAPAPVKKSNEEIANEVINGLWGNGDERKQRLTAAGYDYAAVQAIVNQKVSPAPAPKVEYYTVKKGDNLIKIAKKYGTTVNQLVAWNNIENANLIYAGQKLRVR